MFYPEEWENTLIKITKTVHNFDGINKTQEQEILVRMALKFINAKDNKGNNIIGNGSFYKKGELEISNGDNFIIDDVEYTVKNVSCNRNAKGEIEFTRVDF